ncbi:synaptotagmin-15 [Eurytemora carolleeae]|uniref:synaptotagmin-15 n=1 Tax=Eurytemora carolleeae TaxID=1294199 RepID=UPI000C79046D|nr:synaptotagmin-15 [Eurytemora carolleeae]|eukprot:XP_023323110.1 synaptotagmin-15-like [Eurytemora affinis]
MQSPNLSNNGSLFSFNFQDISKSSSIGMQSSPRQSPRLVSRSDSIPQRRELGELNPSLYRSVSLDSQEFFGTEEGPPGRVYIKMKYSVETENLDIFLNKIKCFKKTSLQGSKASVRLKLLPDDRRCLTSKQLLFTEDSALLFKENFQFHVNKSDLANRTLDGEVEMKSRGDKKGKPCYWFQKKLAEIEIDELTESFSMTCLRVDMFSTKPVELGGGIKLRTSLAYNPDLERLTLAVFQCQGIKDEEDEPLDTYVKVSLTQNLKVVKSKKSDLSKKSNSPSFDQRFDFKVENSNLQCTSIFVHLKISKRSFKRERILGQIIIGPKMFARGSGLSQWELALGSPKEQIFIWHELSKPTTVSSSV